MLRRALNDLEAPSARSVLLGSGLRSSTRPTAGQLRAALADLPDNAPSIVHVASESDPRP
ncbi:DUF6225 family protein [Nonomuraea sp. MTCD27]|uniref:DUF6225 family protein n=1 Tax=Nonomuraea sp. MTCD27 TaxID=1676747 RepID=UPI0035C0D81E